MEATRDHDVRLSANIADLRAAAERLKADSSERDRLQQDPVSYLAEIGVHLGGDTATAVKQRAGVLASSPRQASVVHIDL